MNRKQIMEAAQKLPQYRQVVQLLQQQSAQMPLTAEALSQMIRMLEGALNNPDQYAEIRAAAIQDGIVDAEDMPEQYDKILLISLLAAFYGLEDAEKAKGFARGGLATASNMGRGGDTMLAHINPVEAMRLRQMGGSGAINPQTGLPEYGFLKKLFKAVVPIATMIFAPYLAPMLAPMMGAYAGIGAGALMGGLGSALSGGNFAKGAVMGGITGGAGDMLGQGIGKMSGLSAATSDYLGNALAGGVAGAADGRGFGTGAVMGAAGKYLGDTVSGMGAKMEPGAWATGVQNAGQNIGRGLTAGMDPKSAIVGGGLSALASNYFPKPGQSPGELAANAPGTANVAANDISKGMSADEFAKFAEGRTPSPLAQIGKGFNLSTALPLLALAGMSGAPAEVQAAVPQMSPEQKEYFNRPTVQLDWTRMGQDASRSGQSLTAYMAGNWPAVSSGRYNLPPGAPKPVGMARGGALNQIAQMQGEIQGDGDGRDDTVEARLSDGEYVFDAETVALLGDGSTSEGAKRLDQMRMNIRAHKGKVLAKGKISPDALSPLAYLKGVA